MAHFQAYLRASAKASAISAVNCSRNPAEGAADLAEDAEFKTYHDQEPIAGRSSSMCRDPEARDGSRETSDDTFNPTV